MSPTPCPSPDELAAFDRGDLPPDAIDRVAAHVEECPACEAALAAREGGATDTAGAAVRRTPAGPAPPPVGAGSVLAGRYRLVEPVGEGGMGVVWRADQTEPVRRRVAVKLVKPGMDSAAVLRRFEAERQALALMDHPNIARVFDAGTTDAGRPFFAMELVEGVPVTAYCDAKRLTPRERLGLFVPVCRAVQHAHQKGVIHRDIKPSNVLVAEVDGRPVPKVIDFGIAKAAGAALTDHTLVTGVGSVVGTPEYMAPEQAELNQLDVDTRADVYSLGVLLYELLTGSTPLTRGRLREAALLEVLRLVREEESPPPSSRLSTADALPSIAADRGTEPRRLTALLRGELDWVVLKALEKDRTRRYETVSGLARDVERYLADEPVEAGRPGVGYRLRKFARRNRGPVLAGALLVGALLAGLAGTAYGLVRAEQARRAEADQRQRADERRLAAEAKEAEANAIMTFFSHHVFLAASPKGVYGGLARDVTLRAAIAASLPALDKAFPDQPLVEARLRSTLGTTFLSLGDAGAAAEQYERAVAIFTRAVGPDHTDTLQHTGNLAASYRRAGRLADAVRLHEMVLAGLRKNLGPAHPDTLNSMDNLALSYQDAGRHGDAIRLHEAALAGRRGLGPDHPDTLNSMVSLAISYRDAGRHGDALGLQEEALTGRRRVLGPDHPDTIDSMNNLADGYLQVKRFADALAMSEAAVRAARSRFGPDHPAALISACTLAEALVANGRSADAIPVVDDCAARAAGRPVHPGILPTVLAIRRDHFRRAGDPAGCRTTAAMWEKAGGTSADSLYQAACYRAVAAGVYADTNQQPETAADADRAMGWLVKAVAAGFRDRGHMAQDSHLSFLRGRADFRALLATLPEQAPPPRPAR